VAGGPTFFDAESALRIANAVRKVEIGDRSEAPLQFDTVPPSQQRRTFRIATFDGAWATGEYKTVTFKYQTNTPNTASVMNLFCGLDAGSGSPDISIAREGAGWYLVQVNMTQLSGYATSGTQVLTIQNGVLSWIGTTAC
jgi:hypothetical protein